LTIFKDIIFSSYRLLHTTHCSLPLPKKFILKDLVRCTNSKLVVQHFKRNTLGNTQLGGVFKFENFHLLVKLFSSFLPFSPFTI